MFCRLCGLVEPGAVARSPPPPPPPRVQLVQVQNATAAYFQLLVETLAARGKYLWQAFSS